MNLPNTYPLSDFQENTRDHILRLRESGKPEVLTVNGEAEVVVQSAHGYQKLLADQEMLESIRSVSRGLEQARRGEGRPMRDFLKRLGAENGILLK